MAGLARISIALTMVLGSVAGCGDKGGVPDAGLIDATPPGGTITMFWKFTDDGEPVDNNPCERLGAVAVRVTATPIDNVQGGQFSFDCEDLAGTTGELPAATYGLRIEALGVGLTVLGDPIMESGVVVESSQDTSIGEVTFDTTFTGSVTFTINTREADGNCGDAPPPDTNDGAGLTGLVISLRDPLLNCKNATFEIPTDGGTVDFNDTCADAIVDLGADDCIENDVTITIRDVESGPARLLISGYQDETECYTREGGFSFTVVGAGETYEFGERVITRVDPPGLCSFPDP